MKNKLPLVTVIVPSYNHELYITKCIESIINQTYKNIELIVIDDGSTDKSVDILKKLKSMHTFKLIEHKKNLGLSSTKNEGLSIAKGKYIAGCASDDYWELRKIEKQVSQMEKDSSIGICYGKTQAIDTSDTYINGPKIFKAYSGYVFKRLLFSNFIPAPTVLIRKDVYENVGAYDPEIKIEDWYMWLKVAKVYKIDYIDEVVAYYRQHDSNYSKNYLTMLKYDLQIINLWKREGIMYFLSYLNAFRRYIKNRFFI